MASVHNASVTDDAGRSGLRSPLFAAGIFLFSSLMLHWRGRARLAMTRQLGDHSTLTAPYSLLVYAASKTPSTPYIGLEAFPDLGEIVHSWRVIRDEGRRLADAGGMTTASGAHDIGFNTFFKRGWTRFYLRWYGETPPSARSACPCTTALLERAPSIKGAMFARLPAGAVLGRHRDPFAGALRFHLGLETPNDDACWIEVDGQRYSWRDGEGVLFDETYVHEARNNTARNRLILLCDVERPLRWPMNAVNRLIMRTIMSSTASANVPGERVGLLNRVFAPIHALLQIGKPLKARNRAAYYAIKRAATAGLALMLLGVMLSGNAADKVGAISLAHRHTRTARRPRSGATPRRA